jgi:hypothetical protein
MFIPDSETRRLLVRERQAELQREAQQDALTRPVVVESRRRRRGLELRRLRFRLRVRPAGGPS